jgi:ABC-type glycerol-3-phosphate transport system substrate-binding protein
MTDAPISRRALLKVAGVGLLRAGGLATATTPLVAACADGRQQVEVFVVWSDRELSTFQSILDQFRKDQKLNVNVVPVGDQLDELIRARFDADNPPDVVITPRPGRLKPYTRRIASLDQILPASVTNDLLPGLRKVVTEEGEESKVYGLWVKVTHKSLVWYRQSTFAEERPPDTWGEFVSLVGRLAKEKRLTPLSVGAADDWVLTDWFENALVGVANTGEEVYNELTRGENGENPWGSEAVGEALTKLAKLWSIPDVFPFGPARALLTQFEESVVQVFASRRASMVFEGDFVEGLIKSLPKGIDPYKVFRFPPSEGARSPLVIGGDVAMLPLQANDRPSEGGKKLVKWLANPKVFTPWIEQGGFLSPYRSIPPGRYPSQLAIQRAQELQSAEKVYFDLSDQLSGRLASGQGRGMGLILQDFFAAVSTPGGDVKAAVKHAQEQLVEAARLTSSQR